ncbi:MAG: MucB/RseB C-terminal domain-containing protein [Gammaproteobacteria bacterium]
MRLPALVLLAAIAPVLVADDPRQWLDDMSSALNTLDYDGTFVYLHDDRLEAMRIIHRLDNGGVRERLVSLTGSAREVVRDEKAVTCIMADSKSVMVGQSRPRQPFPVVPSDFDTLSRTYSLEDAGEDRMAGHMTRIISITPRDGFRYGYRYWIDQETRMLLKSDVTDVNGRAIEQMMFTHLEIGHTIPEDALKPSLTGDGYAWSRQHNGKASPAADPGTPGWRVNELPAGFQLTNFQHKRIHQDADMAEHMVFSDGLATVSVYVEKMRPDGAGFTGLSSQGAMNAFGNIVDGYQITVVGEVPSATVEMMAQSVVRVPPVSGTAAMRK